MRGPAIRVHADEEGIKVAVRGTQHCNQTIHKRRGARVRQHEKEEKQVVGEAREDEQKERERDTPSVLPEKTKSIAECRTQHTSI